MELKKGFKMNGKVDSSSYQRLVQDLQNHVTYHTGEWLRPDKVSSFLVLEIQFQEGCLLISYPDVARSKTAE